VRLLKLSAIVGLALLIATPDARADLVYAQPPGQFSFMLLVSSTLNNFGNPPGFRTADNFALAANTVITDVHWWGKLATGGENFQFTFYADGGGVPGAVLASSGGSLSKMTVNVGSPFDPVTFYSSDLDTPFTATAGTTYWLSVFDQSPDASWQWLDAENVGDGGRQGENPGPPWNAGTPDLAFELTGTPALTSVPEPSALALLGAGGVALAGWRRWRRPA
jgi:hypothetical protein